MSGEPPFGRGGPREDLAWDHQHCEPPWRSKVSEPGVPSYGGGVYELEISLP